MPRVIFVDLTKAYDWVPKEDIWRCTRERNEPEKYVRLIQDMCIEVAKRRCAVQQQAKAAASTWIQTCQVSRNFRESPEIVHDLQVSRKCYKISRNLGNLIDFYLFAKIMLLVWIREVFDVNPRDAEHRDLKLAPARTTIASELRLHSLFVSPEDGATRGTGTAQWRHHVMIMATGLDDQDSRNFTCSTWQLCGFAVAPIICIVWSAVLSGRMSDSQSSEPGFESAKSVKRFERSNWMDTALYKNYLNLYHWAHTCLSYSWMY